MRVVNAFDIAQHTALMCRDGHSSHSGVRSVGCICKCLLLAAALTLVACGQQSSDNDQTQRSQRDHINIVIYLIDTLRADRVGIYGYNRPTTPRIDALAASAVVFERAYAPAPWTLPSVASLMTSAFPCEHGVVVDGQKIGRT